MLLVFNPRRACYLDGTLDQHSKRTCPLKGPEIDKLHTQSDEGPPCSGVEIFGESTEGMGMPIVRNSKYPVRNLLSLNRQSKDRSR